MIATFRNKTLAIFLLILWFFAAVSGVHGHFCFDGQEQPLLIHLNILSDHPDDTTHKNSSEQHLDADVNILQFAAVKLVKIDLPLFLSICLFLFLLFEKSTVAISSYSYRYVHCFIGFRPPLRAPPFSPA